MNRAAIFLHLWYFLLCHIILLRRFLIVKTRDPWAFFLVCLFPYFSFSIFLHKQSQSVKCLQSIIHLVLLELHCLQRLLFSWSIIHACIYCVQWAYSGHIASTFNFNCFITPLLSLKWEADNNDAIKKCLVFRVKAFLKTVWNDKYNG